MPCSYPDTWYRLAPGLNLGPYFLLWFHLVIWFRVETPNDPGPLDGLGVDVLIPGVLLGRLFFLVQDGAGTFALSLGSLEY